ncbi:MAG: glycosyl hydrolase [Candidatus Methylacidiphilales bacterium]|nr:glycosyl hydrolase [Candidatus Methylacidiphilales bacterium]
MITRRTFIGLSTAAAALTTTTGFSQETVPVYLQSGSKKKGFCTTAGDSPGWAEKLTSLHAKWFYTWAGFVPDDAPKGMAFVPMIRSRHSKPEMVAKIRESFAGHDIKEVLGFNEPDTKHQDGLTVEQALDLWPMYMETGLRIGSPACVHPDKQWMIDFMAGVEERKLRVDFVCIHSYGGPNPEAFLNRLEKVHEMFNRPLWITEFAVGDWNAKTVEENKHDPKTVLRFMDKVLPKLDRLDFLERYSWFSASADSPPVGTSALFDLEGKLTELGQCYRDA